MNALLQSQDVAKVSDISYGWLARLGCELNVNDCELNVNGCELGTSPDGMISGTIGEASCSVGRRVVDLAGDKAGFTTL